MRLESNGTMVGNSGYIRGTVSRRSPAFTDFQMQSLVLDNQSDICKETQQITNYTGEFPPLQAQAGDFIALQYQENGHVTLPENTPQKSNSGTVYVYGTSSPRSGEKLSTIHNIWNIHGTGGDGRGRLLGTWSFDDGQCYQINSGEISLFRQKVFYKEAMDPQGADLWCQNDVQLPQDIRDWYTLYWVWDWPTDSMVWVPQMEIYTSCMDIYVTEGAAQEDVSFIRGQDLNMAGIEQQMMIV